jgi:hypothetical protein
MPSTNKMSNTSGWVATGSLPKMVVGKVAASTCTPSTPEKEKRCGLPLLLLEADA